MKRLITFLTLLFIFSGSRAQNMVPNGDFEYYTGCPTFVSQVDSCLGWQPFHSGSSDFFNSCASAASTVSIPVNTVGYQAAASGNGYMGFVTRLSNYKEYIERNIIPLTPGRLYEVSLSVSTSDFFTCATDDIGVYFYCNRPIYSSRSTSIGFATLPLIPQATFPLVADTQNWTRVVDTLLADSAYSGIIIGSFKDVAAQVVSCVNPLSSDGYAYIDSVIVRKILYIVNQCTERTICTGDTFNVPYSAYPGVFNTGNTFTVQLSNASGNFVSGTTNIGSHTSQTSGSIQCVIPSTVTLGSRYKLRILSSSIIDSSEANDYNIQISAKPIVNIGSNSPICDNTNLNLSATTTSSGVSYSWSGPNSFTSTLSNPVISPATLAANGDYYITATLNGCSIKDTVSVQVTPIPRRPITTANSPVCIGQSLNLTANSINGTTYFWEGPAGFSMITQNPLLPNANLSMAGKYRVRAVTNACTSIEDTINVAVIAAPSVGIYPSPKDSICQGSPISFVGTPTNGGISPQYQWYRNGVAVPGATTRTPSITPVNDKDIFYCTMTTTGICTDPFTDTSNVIPITVMPWLAPSVSIVANPNTPVAGGQMINFTATPVDAGKAPTYQWKRNGSDVIGAVSNIWGANNLDNNDTICVIVKSSYQCPMPATAKSNCIVVQINTTGITLTQLLDNISIYPNPLTNELTIEGIKSKTTIQLFDVVGKIVYSGIATTDKETINTSALPTGTYILQLALPDGQKLNAKITKQ